jgi:D-aminoacyl-tRNA deacylase
MRALVQRVREAAVVVDGSEIGRIGPGLLVYVGIAPDDDSTHAAALAEKIVHLRIFPDAAEKLNLSVAQTGGGILAIPNFSLMADTRKGRRPAFNPAAPAGQAQPLHEQFLAELRTLHPQVAGGQFGADMAISAIADGPLNVLLEVD